MTGNITGMAGPDQILTVSSIDPTQGVASSEQADVVGLQTARNGNTNPVLVHCQVGVGCTNTPEGSGAGAGLKRN